MGSPSIRTGAALVSSASVSRTAGGCCGGTGCAATAGSAGSRSRKARTDVITTPVRHGALRTPGGDDRVDCLTGFQRPVQALEPAAPQRIAHLAVRLGESEPDSARLESRVQIRQQRRPGEVDPRHLAEKQDDQVHSVFTRVEKLKDTLADVLRVEV